MRNRQDKRLWRGSMLRLMVSFVTVAMLALVAGGAQAAPPPSGKAADAVAPAAAKETVLASEYGKARSSVRGTFGKAGTVTGTFTPQRFAARNGRLIAVGRLDATMVRGNGQTVGSEHKRIRIPVRRANGEAVRMAALAPSCDILHLVLGPLDLDLLGLEVHLDKVVLDIIATPGPGNLLGNLLCAVAGLLDGGLSGLLDQISQILNSILAILRL